jgi:cellulose biosynthesis protein BcsQ
MNSQRGWRKGMPVRYSIRLKEGIESISDRFDVVVMDPPPALRRDLAIGAARSEFALVVPVPPTVMDFSSTAAFLSMLDETIEQLADRGSGAGAEVSALRCVERSMRTSRCKRSCCS